MDNDPTRIGGGGNELAQIEARASNRPAGNKACDALAFGDRAGNLFARAHYRPVTGAFKGEIEVAECWTNIGIPGAARANVNYVASGIEHYRSRVFERQFDRPVFFQWRGHDDANQIVAATREIAAADGFILDELGWIAVDAHLRESEVARQFQDHRPQPGVLGRKGKFGFSGEVCGRLHFNAQLVV